MRQFGNSAGRNKGKKYIKLTGNEIATTEAERKGKHFVDWYGAFYKYMRKRWRDFDDEIAADVMLKVYNDILYRGLHLGNYFYYCTRAYNTARLKLNIDEAKRKSTHVSIDSDDESCEMIAAPDFDYALHEEVVDQINREIMDFVRGKFSAMEISIFEIYIGLQPSVSYVVMGEMLGISANRIYLIVSAIKRDLSVNYAERRNYLLSLL